MPRKPQPLARRAVEAYDLVLFATNTGELYQLHRGMARGGLSLFGWRDYVRDRVLPLYSKQVEPVTCSQSALINVARELKEYYERHNAEADQCAPVTK